MKLRALTTLSAVSTLTIVSVVACRFDPSYRNVNLDAGGGCTSGEKRCNGTSLEQCTARTWKTVEDCSATGLTCAPGLYACTRCKPGSAQCDGTAVVRCKDDGSGYEQSATCNAAVGEVCAAGLCVNLCAQAEKVRSNVGCEYWAVDLDNANVGASTNAAAQQFAVVVSNAVTNVPAHVTIEQDDALPGQPAKIRTVASATVTPNNLEVFKLGPREVDGSEEGTFNTGTGTALTRAAFRVRSTVPIVAYQFNPLENANVFSNDASQLLPRSALGGGSGRAYVVSGWPQTIATSSIPNQNFGQDLRAFVTIVGTSTKTNVKVRPATRVISGGPFNNGIEKGEEVSLTLEPFDVLNLESGGFNADFTGTLIDADGPVAVFTGSEASDAPFFSSLSERSCCADHLEEQSPPLRTAGKEFVLARAPNRSEVIIAAGAKMTKVAEPEYVRVMSVLPGKTVLTTSLPAPNKTLTLDGEGAFVTITATRNFTLSASQPVFVTQIQSSQEAAGIARGLPGGDPSLTFIPPNEQFRSEYVFLTPDKYAFDFVVITAPADARVFMDGAPLGGCEIAPGDGLSDSERGGKQPAFISYRCQLSFPTIDPNKAAPDNVLPGIQNDGVHRVIADKPVGIMVYGFDSFVSYGYAGGTELAELIVP